MKIEQDLRKRAMDSKKVKVSSKRQITIPIDFYEKLNIGNEIECCLVDNQIVLRPVKQDTEFAEEILKDLIEKGLSGPELLAAFQKTRAKVRPAVERMINEADRRAQKITSDKDEMAEIFGREE